VQGGITLQWRLLEVVTQLTPFDLVTLTSFMIMAGKYMNTHQYSEAHLFLKIFVLAAEFANCVGSVIFSVV